MYHANWKRRQGSRRLRCENFRPNLWFFPSVWCRKRKYHFSSNNFLWIGDKILLGNILVLISTIALLNSLLISWEYSVSNWRIYCSSSLLLSSRLSYHYNSITLIHLYFFPIIVIIQTTLRPRRTLYFLYCFVFLIIVIYDYLSLTIYGFVLINWDSI